MSRATQVLLQQAKAVDATPQQINAAARGHDRGVYDRKQFETPAQVRAFLVGHDWIAEARTVKVKRAERGWIVRWPPPEDVGVEYQVGVPDVANPVMTRSVGDGNRYAEKFAALQQILAGTNAEAWP